MPAPLFDQINRVDRDKLILKCGSDFEAQRFWDEAVRPMVDAGEVWGMRSKSVTAKSSGGRFGKDLAKHMQKVALKTKELRALLDADTLQRLTMPPAQVLWADAFGARQDRNIQRVRDLRRLLEEIEFEIEVPRSDAATGETKSLVNWADEDRPLQHRLDCFLAASVVRWLNVTPTVATKPADLLDVVFLALQINAGRDAQAQAGATYRGIDSIRDARARKLIP